MKAPCAWLENFWFLPTKESKPGDVELHKGMCALKVTCNPVSVDNDQEASVPARRHVADRPNHLANRLVQFLLRLAG